jgi:hypothetical protein
MINNSEKLILQILNARVLQLHNTRFIEEKDAEGNIITLINDDLKISTSVPFTYKNSKYKINIIESGYDQWDNNCYYLKYAALTMSSIYVTPLLGCKRKDMYWEKQFVNTFLSTDLYDECIALLYRFSGDVEFIKFESSLKDDKLFLNFIDVDKHHVLYIFKVPDYAQEAYHLIRNGKYSEIDDLWKIYILNFHDLTREGHTAQVLYKDLELKRKLELELDVNLGNAELLSVPNMKFERFNLDYYSITKNVKYNIDFNVK